jgi:hypothetical protein
MPTAITPRGPAATSATPPNPENNEPVSSSRQARPSGENQTLHGAAVPYPQDGLDKSRLGRGEEAAEANQRVPTATNPPGAATNQLMSALAKTESAPMTCDQATPSSENQTVADEPLSSITEKPSCHAANVGLGTGPAATGIGANRVHGPAMP